MTLPLGQNIDSCYALLFTAESEFRKGNHHKALLCYESCRKMSLENLLESEVFIHSLLRAARKESQILRLNKQHKRAFRILSELERSLKKFNVDELDLMLIYAQLSDLSEHFDTDESDYYHARLVELSAKLD